ncbi:MAG: FG-GAP-like repeat-containing protein [Cyclobacteriaceae bacterium]|nr:FG-GAP-like repeat-containing protein [Cyclobacteriaceae bacterium]
MKTPAVLLFSLLVTLIAPAQHTKLFDFTGTNGTDPWGSLITDGTHLYGMTAEGGSNNNGTIFKILPDGTGFAKLFDFQAATSGSFTPGSLVFDGTFLYGMAADGGSNNDGTVFRIRPDGSGFSVLLPLASATTGATPYGSLYWDGTFLYGMTSVGGANNFGTLFKILPDGTGFSKLLDFNGTGNGSFPFGSLISDGTFLYGMTSSGGTSNFGTIFKVLKDGTGYQRLLNFTGAANGREPNGTLLYDGSFLYGMTLRGGTANDGTIFRIRTDGTGFGKLFDFNIVTQFADSPFGDLVTDGTHLYGMTYFGGVGGTNDYGTLFRIAPNGTGFTRLHDFTAIANGWLPYGSPLLIGSTLYGLTQQGGAGDQGTVFRYALPVGGPPTITSFAPASGPIGTSVTITGTNFDTTPANNIVYFGATRAAVTAATSTQLTVTVPTGATYAPITVLNAATNLQAYSMGNFTPTFTPNKGTIIACDFSPKVDFPANANPGSSAAADFDGDGKVDLVTGNNGGLTLSVFRNTSTGVGNISYAAPIDLSLIAFPQSVAVGDLDGDGKPDILVANHQFANNNVSVFRNTSTAGSLSFAPRVSFAPAEDPSSVAIGDVDGDGKADLAVTNQGSNSVSIFRNTGTGPGTITYAARVDFTTGTTPVAVLLGDLDGDRKPDLAVVNNGGNTVSVFRNTSTGAGNIAYAARIDVATGTGPRFVSAGDLDEDGKLELAVANTGNTSVSVLRNTSTGVGNIGFAPRVDFVTGLNPRSVSIGDLNGDSKADLAVANAGNERVSVFRNTSTAGTISLEPKVDLITAINPNSVAIADLDGDGKADLTVTNSGSSSLSVLRNNPNLVGDPTLASFVPIAGPVGTSVTITGTNFSLVPAENVVRFFNNRTATVTASTATTLTVTVPTGATTGRISVTTNCVTVTSATDFTVGVVALPAITSFTPTSGPIGATVTITGTNFGTTPANNTAAFNGTTAVVTASTTTSITTSVPTGGTTGKITVTVNGNTATSATDFTVTTLANQPPVIQPAVAAVPINGIVTLDLLPLLSDPDDNLDLATLALVSSTSEQGASLTLSGTATLTLDYGGVAFAGTDRVEISICDMANACTQQNLEIEVGGDVTVYNAFSPDGNIQNPIFFIEYIELLPEARNNRVLIFNRWGDEVWAGDNYDNSRVVFAGKNNTGNELPSGTYFYKILFNATGKTQTGYLVLRR